MKQGWEIKTLKDIGSVFSGNSINAKVKKEKYLNYPEGFPYVATKDVGYDASIDYDNGVKIPFPEKGLFRIASKNSVLICAEGGSAGRKMGRINQDICFVNKLFAITPENKTSSKYLFYWYNTNEFQREFKSRLTGLIGGVSKKKFETIPIPVPPLDEQKRIVAKLDECFEAIDKARANVEKNLKNAKELFQSKLNEIFSQKGDGWVEKKLGEVCDGVQYGTSKKALKEGKIPVIRMGNIQNGHITWDDLAYTNDKEEIEKYSLEKNDVLFNRTNSPELVGKSAIYRGERPAIFAGYLIRVNRKKNLLNGAYLNYYLNLSSTRMYGFSVMISSVNQANINGTKLKEYSISFPSKDKQLLLVKKLDKFKSQTQSLESNYQQELDALDELKKSILQKVFNGEL